MIPNISDLVTKQSQWNAQQNMKNKWRERRDVALCYYNGRTEDFTETYFNRNFSKKIPIANVNITKRIIGAELTFIGFDEFDVESWKNCDMAFKKAIGRMRGSDNC